jgi:hypothetical protein
MRLRQKSHCSLLELVTQRWTMILMMRTWMPTTMTDAPLRFHSMSDILRTPGFTPRALVAEELHMVSSDEPASFTEAEHSPSWRKVMMEEMDSIDENGT